MEFLALYPLIQEKNYSERVMLIYDGLHYDALGVSFLDSANSQIKRGIC